jgi:RNA recognition motif-containing protein
VAEWSKRRARQAGMVEIEDGGRRVAEEAREGSEAVRNDGLRTGYSSNQRNRAVSHESDEEGEVKEATGLPRDLREVLKGKRGDKERRRGAVKGFDSMPEQGSHGRGIGSLSMVSAPPPSHTDAGRGIRREDGFHKAEGGRGGGFVGRGGGEDNFVRRRGPSPFRPRDVPQPIIPRRGSPPPPPQLSRRNVVPERGAVEFARSRSRERAERMDRDRRSPPNSFRRADVGGFEPEPVRPAKNCVLHITKLPPGLSVDRARGELLLECERFGHVVDMRVFYQGNDRAAYVQFADPGTAELARRGMHRFVMQSSQLEVEIEGDRGGRPSGATGVELRRGASPPPMRRQPLGVVEHADMPPGAAKRRPPDVADDVHGCDARRRGGPPPPDDWEAPRRRGEHFEDVHHGGGRRPPPDLYDDRRPHPDGGFGGGERRRTTDAYDDMHDPSATCRVCIDDLHEDVTENEVMSAMKPFGYIENIEIQQARGRAMAFVKFRALSSAVRARRDMDGQRIGDRRCKVDYAMGKPSPQIWVGSVHASVSESEVAKQFSRYGRVVEVTMNRQGKCAYVLFEGIKEAEEAAKDMRGRTLAPSAWRIKVDFNDYRPSGSSKGIGLSSTRRGRSISRPRGSSPPRHLTRESSPRGSRSGAASRPPSTRTSSPPRQQSSMPLAAGEGASRLVLVLDRETVFERDIRDKELHQHFMRYGAIAGIEWHPDGRHAYVSFIRKESAEDAANDPDGLRLGAALGVVKMHVDMPVSPEPGQKRRRESWQDDRGKAWPEEMGYDKRQHVGSNDYAPQHVRSSDYAPQHGQQHVPPSHPPHSNGGYVTGSGVPVMTDTVIHAGADVVLYDDHAYAAQGRDQVVVQHHHEIVSAPASTGHNHYLQPGAIGFTAAHGVVSHVVPMSLADILEARFPAQWRGACCIKNAAAAISLHRISGDTPLEAMLVTQDNKIVITQRMRLEHDKVVQFSSRLPQLSQPERPNMLLAVGRDGADNEFQTLFVSYLQERNAAGVVQTETGYQLYLFPPGEVALRYMLDYCPELDLSKEGNYLLAVLINPVA